MTVKRKNISLITLLICFITCIATAVAVSVNTFNAKANEDAVQTGMSITLKDDVTVNLYAVGISNAYAQADMKITYRGNEYTQTADVLDGKATFKFNKITPQYFT